MAKDSIEIEGLDFSSDLRAFDDHIRKNEELYEEIHGVFKRVSGGGSGVMGLGHTRDIAEVGKTLSSIRSAGLSGVNQRFAAKKSVVELKMKEKQIENGQANLEDSVSVARAMLRQISEERIDAARKGTPIQEKQTTQNGADKARLRERIDHELESGSIKTTANERAMKYDFQGKVDYAYDTSREKIVAVEKGSSRTISDYPEERIPRMQVIKVENGQAITSSGSNIQVIDSGAKKK